MTFSQGWDAGFRAILIYVGVIFFWLGLIEQHFPSQSTSVVIMNLVAAVLAAAYVLHLRKRAITERRRAEAEVAVLMQEQV